MKSFLKLASENLSVRALVCARKYMYISVYTFVCVCYVLCVYKVTLIHQVGKQHTLPPSPLLLQSSGLPGWHNEAQYVGCVPPPGLRVRWLKRLILCIKLHRAAFCE